MKISFSLSSKSVLEAKNKIKEYQKTYTKTLNDIIKQTADDSVKYAKKQLLKYNAYYSGRTYNSIYVLYTNKRKFRIHFGGASPYVEFGTGIIGQQHPHPEAEKRGIVYDVNKHGLKGWIYYDDVAHKTRWTMGMESRPFIMKTRDYMKRRYAYLLKKRLGGK